MPPEWPTSSTTGEPTEQLPKAAKAAAVTFIVLSVALSVLCQRTGAATERVMAARQNAVHDKKLDAFENQRKLVSAPLVSSLVLSMPIRISK